MDEETKTEGGLGGGWVAVGLLCMILGCVMIGIATNPLAALGAAIVCFGSIVLSDTLASDKPK